MTSKDDKGVEPVSTGSLVNLNPAEVEGLKKRFQEGDAVAAYRLYQYFAFARSDEVEGDAWLLRAAEAGHRDAVYALAATLTSREKYTQAHEWATKARSMGHEKAAELLVEIDEALAAGR